MPFGINRFHLFVLFTWQFSIFFATQLIYPIFTNYVPQWSCDNGPLTRSCEVYEKCTGNITFSTIAFHSTAIEFDWLCGPKAYLRSASSQTQFVGVLLGTGIMGALSDAYGRKPIATISLATGIAADFATGLCTSWQQFVLARFIVGWCVGGTLVVVITLCMELLLPQQRMVLRAFFNWGVARLAMTLICMYVQDWRQSSFALAVAALPALLSVVFILPESPTWLHRKGRLVEMRESEKRMAYLAGVKFIPSQHGKIEATKGVCEMIHSSGMIKKLSVLWCMWFIGSFCGYATDLNSNTLSGDFFLNQILFSIIIAASKMIIVTLDTLIPSFSRRMLHQGSQAIVCFCFFLLTIFTVQEYTGFWYLLVNLLGTMFIEYTWDANYLCAIESMHTSFRASATGTCSLVARIGAIVAPLLAHANTVWPAALFLTVGIIGFVNLLVSFFFLAETKGVNLDAVTVEDDEEGEEVEMLKS